MYGITEGLVLFVLEQSTDGQRYLLLLVVDVDDLSLDNLANLQLVLRLCDAVISDLRNVDQAVNARYDLSECAERHELEDLNLSNRTDVVLGLEYVPRIVLLALVAEGDLLVFLIQTDNEYLYLVANRNDLGRVLDAAPGQLGDVNHAVYAADVYECAVGSQGLNGAVVLVADLDGVPDLLSSSLASLSLDLTDRTNNALALTVDLGDIEGLLGLNQLAHRLILRYAGLGCRDEYANAVCSCNNTAAVLLNDNTLNNGVLLVSLLNGLPALQLINALLGQSDGALAVVYANNNSLDLVANVDVGSYVIVRVVRQLTQRDIRSVLNAQIYLYVVIGNTYNGAGYLFSII